jgi:hypothetical protein
MSPEILAFVEGDLRRCLRGEDEPGDTEQQFPHHIHSTSEFPAEQISEP